MMNRDQLRAAFKAGEYENPPISPWLTKRELIDAIAALPDDAEISLEIATTEYAAVKGVEVHKYPAQSGERALRQTGAMRARSSTYTAIPGATPIGFVAAKNYRPAPSACSTTP
jgi:hypothetical protein